MLKQVLEKKILEVPFFISSWEQGLQLIREVHQIEQGRVQSL